MMDESTVEEVVIDIQPSASAGSAIYEKYGEAALAGFQSIPDVLFKNQGQLGLSPTDLVVLLNVLMHWWYPHQKPFPRAHTIAQRMEVTPRTVQRSLNSLERLGLLDRERKTSGGPTYLDPTPLVEKLSKIAETDASYIARQRLRDRGNQLDSKPAGS